MPSSPHVCSRTKVTYAQRARNSCWCVHTKTGSARESTHEGRFGAIRARFLAEVLLVRAHQGQFSASCAEALRVVDRQGRLDADSASNLATWASD